MPRRDSKGRFVKSLKSSMRRRRHKGMGSIVTVRRGMGQLDMDTLMPPIVGGGVAALTSLALRWFVDPAQGTTQQMLVKNAPLFGMATGSLASLALYMMGGAEQGVRSLVSATLVSLFGFGSDFVLKEKQGQLLAAMASTPALAPTAGFGAIVPEYGRSMGAIVMEPTQNGQRPGSIGSYGETVSLSGVDTSAFGTPGFRA